MYSSGRGVPKDESKGLELLEAAAAQGVAQAQFVLGSFTFDGWVRIA